MGRVRAPPCHHLTQNPGPARLPNGIGERHILHASEEVPGHPLGFPPILPYAPNFRELRLGEVRRIPLLGNSVNKAYSTTSLGQAVARSWRADTRPT
jgi:hypothetical protein